MEAQIFHTFCTLYFAFCSTIRTMYESPRTITKPISNNRLNYGERRQPTIVVPALREGTIDDVQIGEHVAIECEVDGEMKSGK